MSRQLKKLRGKDMLEALVDSEEDIPTTTQQTAADRKKENKKKKRDAAAKGSDDDEAPPPPPREQAKPKGGGKKKKKPAAKAAHAADDDDSDDIDALLQAHAKKAGPGKGKAKAAPAAAEKPAEKSGSSYSYADCFKKEVDWTKDKLSCHLRCKDANFDANDELRRMFGTATINQERRENQEGQREQIQLNRRQGRPGQNGRPMARPIGLRFKPCLLVKPDTDTWPRYQNPGYVVASNAKDEWVLNEAGEDCEKANRLLINAVNSMQVNAFSALLTKYPYHIPVLLKSADIASQLGQFSEAAALTDQAVYSACQSLSDFSFSAPFTERTLPHDKGSNVGVFVVLYKKMQGMVKRGCLRSALEWCKMLFNLDTRDPCHAALMLDYTAIKSGQWQWFIDFRELLSKPSSFDNMKDRRHLAHIASLPSFYYGAALATKLMANSGSGAIATAEAAQADTLLKKAIATYPHVAAAVIQAAKGTSEPGAVELISQAEALPQKTPELAQLYAERSGELWAGPMMKWLVKTMSTVFVEQGTLPVALPADVTGSSVFRHYATCKVSEHMGRVDVLPEEAFEDQPENGGEGVEPELVDLMRAMEEDDFSDDAGAGGAELGDFPSEEAQMMSICEGEVATLTTDVAAFVAAGRTDRTEKIRLNEFVCVTCRAECILYIHHPHSPS